MSTSQQVAPQQVAQLLSTQEVAARLSLSPHTIRSWARDGKLKGIDLGGRSLRFRAEDIEKFVQDAERAQP